ncbi:MAG TPA: cytochrome c [Terracidiphilus sp.]
MPVASALSRHITAVLWVVVCGLVAAFLFAVPSRGASPEPGTGSAVSVKHGSEIFHQRCALCHTQQPGDSLPFGPPNLYQALQARTITSQQAENIIAQGKGTMPAFGAILTKKDIRCVIAYLRADK